MSKTLKKFRELYPHTFNFFDNFVLKSLDEEIIQINNGHAGMLDVVNYINANMIFTKDPNDFFNASRWFVIGVSGDDEYVLCFASVLLTL